MNDEIPKSNGWFPKGEPEQYLTPGAGKTDELPDTKTCSICGNPYMGYGNNPRPVTENGRCCDHCNQSVVIPARIERMNKGLKAYEGGLDEKVVKDIAESMIEEMKEKEEDDDAKS